MILSKEKGEDKNHNSNHEIVTWLRRIKQAGSTLFLVLAIWTFPNSVCRFYRFGCLVNLIISILYHGLQEPVRPQRPHLARLPSSNYEFSCSNTLPRRWDHWILKRCDKAAVCFICLYTGVSASSLDIGNHTALAVALVSITAGFLSGGILMVHEGLVAVALYLTMKKIDSVSRDMQILFSLAAIVGPVVYIYMDAIGAWCTPYRYLWHLCCGCLVAVGGLLHS